ncbi:MAG TPA: cytochrome c [Novosphingobium sp.]|nr:cytochrome c [Novosphingobium sp.]
MRGAALGLAGVLLLAGVSVQAQDEPGSGPTSDRVSAEGAQIYEEICQACHMADARGGGGAGGGKAALPDNPNLADAEFTVRVVVQGRAGMPWFHDMLTPGQIAAVVTYVRGHFNAYTDPVTEADVERLMADTQPAQEIACACS